MKLYSSKRSLRFYADIDQRAADNITGAESFED
jgi:hypothetical protein